MRGVGIRTLGIANIGAATGGAIPYSEKLLATNPFAYWELDEAAGGVAFDSSGNGYDGAYNGVTLNQVITDANGVTWTCPRFDGVNDNVDIFGAGLAGALNTAEGTAALWLRVFNAGEWTAGAMRGMVLRDDAQNTINTINFANDEIGWRHEGNNVAVDGEIATTTLNWFHHALTWSIVDGETLFYFNGTPHTPAGAPTAWVGAMVEAWIGAAGVFNEWNGWCAQAALWDTPQSPATIASLAIP